MARRWTLRTKLQGLVLLIVLAVMGWWWFADPVRGFVSTLLWWVGATAVFFVVGWLWLSLRKKR